MEILCGCDWCISYFEYPFNSVDSYDSKLYATLPHNVFEKSFLMINCSFESDCKCMFCNSYKAFFCYEEITKLIATLMNCLKLQVYSSTPSIYVKNWSTVYTHFYEQILCTFNRRRFPVRFIAKLITDVFQFHLIDSYSSLMNILLL